MPVLGLHNRPERATARLLAACVGCWCSFSSSSGSRSMAAACAASHRWTNSRVPVVARSGRLCRPRTGIHFRGVAWATGYLVELSGSREIRWYPAQRPAGDLPPRSLNSP